MVGGWPDIVEGEGASDCGRMMPGGQQVDNSWRKAGSDGGRWQAGGPVVNSDLG